MDTRPGATGGGGGAKTHSGVPSLVEMFLSVLPVSLHVGKNMARVAIVLYYVVLGRPETYVDVSGTQPSNYPVAVQVRSADESYVLTDVRVFSF